MLFAKTMGHMKPSHLQCFRRQQPKRVDGMERKLGSNQDKSPSAEALADIVGCINAHVVASLKLTTAEIYNVCLLVMEERHPTVLIKEVKISQAWFSNIIRKTRQLPMRRTTTSLCAGCLGRRYINTGLRC